MRTVVTEERAAVSRQQHRIFIGAEPDLRVPGLVLATAVARRMSVAATIDTLLPEERGKLPALCDYQGLALYLAPHQLCLADVAELWNLARSGAGSGAAIWTPYRRAPLVWCNRQATEEIILYACRAGLPGRPGRIAPAWRHVDRYSAEQTKMLVYARPERRPWYDPHQPLARLWQTELQAAIKGGYIAQADYEEALALGTLNRRFYERYLFLFRS